MGHFILASSGLNFVNVCFWLWFIHMCYMKYGGSAAFLYEPLNSGPPMDSHEFCEFIPLVYLHLFICIHMCYSHVLSGWNTLMSVFIYVHVFTCVSVCY